MEHITHYASLLPLTNLVTLKIRGMICIPKEFLTRLASLRNLQVTEPIFSDSLVYEDISHLTRLLLDGKDYRPVDLFVDGVYALPGIPPGTRGAITV